MGKLVQDFIINNIDLTSEDEMYLAVAFTCSCEKHNLLLFSRVIAQLKDISRNYSQNLCKCGNTTTIINFLNKSCSFARDNYRFTNEEYMCLSRLENIVGGKQYLESEEN